MGEHVVARAAVRNLDRQSRCRNSFARAGTLQRFDFRKAYCEGDTVVAVLDGAGNGSAAQAPAAAPKAKQLIEEDS